MIKIKFPLINLKGTISIPSSKSISNRLLLIKSIANSDQEIENLSNAEDVMLLKQVLEENGYYKNFNDGATPFRMMMAYCAATAGEHFITGTDQLLKRPMRTLVEALNYLGGEVNYGYHNDETGYKIKGKQLIGGRLVLDASVSSQFVSSLLLVAPLMKRPLTLILKNAIVSAPYIEMTLSLMQRFGIKAERQENEITIPNQKYSYKKTKVESDWSAAAFWYNAVLFADEASIKIPSIAMQSLQGDAIVAHYYSRLGVATQQEGRSIVLFKQSVAKTEEPLLFDMATCPDLFPALITACAVKNVEATFVNIQTLKYKESNRGLEMQRILESSGSEITVTDESIKLVKGITWAEELNFEIPFDHRIAMAVSTIAFTDCQVSFNNEDCIYKSYPDFYDHLTEVGARVTHTSLVTSEGN
ncbi:MAG: hypothetical protein RIQ89_1775 [Bacteroidota bacterium]|jgi:3-phosphoshikimate 1-carboxyvinyltransferase